MRIGAFRSPRVTLLGPWLLCALVLLAVLSPLAAAQPTSATIAGAIDRSLARQDISRSRVGIYVWDLTAGTELYARNDDLAIAPASNLKLITSATALRVWGPNYRFRTQLLVRNTRVVNGRLSGHLYLRGLGDPSLSTPARQKKLGFTTARLDRLVKCLQARGVRVVTGSVIGDEIWFDGQRRVSSWQPGIERGNCGPLSALTVDGGIVDKSRVANPPVYAAQLLTNALKKAGIKVIGRPRAGRAPADLTVIQEVRSAPLATLLAHLNKMSDNSYAELMTKNLGVAAGGRGTTAAGSAQLRETLRLYGVDLHGLVIADGSGLSYADRLSAHSLVQVLGAMWRRPDFTVYRNSLAVAGVDGTLRKRLRKSPARGKVRAKTGSLNIVSGLSGYVMTANGHTLAFSILIPGKPVNYMRATKAEDAIVAALARSKPAGTRVRRNPRLRQQIVSADRAVHASRGDLEPIVKP